MTLSDEQILTLAKEHGASYTNRHEPVQTSYGFMRASMLAFARALLAKQDDSGSDSVACMAPCEAERVCHETYAALGPMLFDLAERGHPQAEKLLDNLAQAQMVHDDVLPFDETIAPGSAGNEVRPTNQPSVPAQRYYCNKCGYHGLIQVGYQRPNGSGECGYMASPDGAPAAPTPEEKP